MIRISQLKNFTLSENQQPSLVRNNRHSPVFEQLLYQPAKEKILAKNPGHSGLSDSPKSNIKEQRSESNGKKR